MSVTFLVLKGEEGFSQKLLLFFFFCHCQNQMWGIISMLVLSLQSSKMQSFLLYYYWDASISNLFVLKNQGKSSRKGKKWMTFVFLLCMDIFNASSFWCCQIDCRFSLASISLGWWIFLRVFASCQKCCCHYREKMAWCKILDSSFGLR